MTPNLHLLALAQRCGRACVRALSRVRSACPSCRCRPPPRIRSASKITLREWSPSACALCNTGRNSEAAGPEAEGEGPSEGEKSAVEENGDADAAAAAAVR